MVQLRKRDNCMWEKRYRDYLDTSEAYTGKEKDFFLYLLEKEEEITPQFIQSLRENTKYKWGETDLIDGKVKSEKEHIISYLMGRFLSGENEKNYYQQVVRVTVDPKEIKKNRQKMWIYRDKEVKPKNNRGMILWLAEALSIQIDWDSVRQHQFESLINNLNTKLEEI